MPDKKTVGFPELRHDAEFASTRPLIFDELPPQVRMDMQMAIIKTHHEHIYQAIKIFWGRRGCVEYMQQLILSGGDGVGRTRIGFRDEVLTALMNLIELHKIHQR